MSKTTRTEIKYRSRLLRGLLEAKADGTIVRDREDDEDEPFVIQLLRVTETRVFDGRGERWQDKTSEEEILAEVSVADALALAQSITSDAGYCYAVAERRVLTDPQ